jgi:hypothetical protein
VYLHKLYVKGDINFSLHINSRLADEALKIANMKKSEEQPKALKFLPLRVGYLYGFLITIIASIIEIAMGLFLWKVLGWSII